ncbi:Cysteine-rich receptor-like protein kinase 7 [Vitis vinifera]|uniref:Cysteine-rich receptor-like protein kinase 7 n=1 Tax=Vitis vinifera TaxID=29760 RepID=A0A438G9Q7_VITVI|nr:Cysteine-rich receptor-like protein kinase 7 [Vitis vinifera]
MGSVERQQGAGVDGSRVGRDLPTHILLRYINVGLLCVQESADDRPTMSDVVSMLGNESTHKSLSSNPDLEQYLTSWKCTDDPSTRNFTWRLDIPRLPQLAVGMGSVKKYRTGPWNGAGNYSANLRVTINHLGLLQWNILNESNDEWTTMLSSMPVWTLDCKSKDDLMKVLGVKLPDLLEFWLNKSMSLKECEAECLKNCSCVAWEKWARPLYQMSSWGTRVNPWFNKKKKLVAGLVASTISGMLILGLVFWCIKRKKMRIGTGSFGPVFKVTFDCKKKCVSYEAMQGSLSIEQEVAVKSFGVLLLEIVAGIKNRGSILQTTTIIFWDMQTWLLWKQDKALEVMAACLEDSCIESQLLRCIQVGLLCVENLPADRPAMSSVIFTLDATTGREELPSENVVTISVPEGSSCVYAQECGFCSDLS